MQETTAQKNFPEVPIEARLSADQWRSLGRLANRYQRLEEASEFVAQHFGGDITEHTLRLSELVQDPRLSHTLRELVETLNVLAETGLLQRLREFLRFIAEGGEHLDTDRLIGEFTKSVGDIPVAGFMAALRSIDMMSNREIAAGGMRGLLRVMRDPQVQCGLVTLCRLSSHLDNRQAR